MKKKNEKIIDEYRKLKENIDKQEVIISNLSEDCDLLDEEKIGLNKTLEEIKKELKVKLQKTIKNNKELNVLLKKSTNLNNDKIIKSEIYTTKINGFPTTLKTAYTDRINQLKKNINFYKRQNKFTDDLINKLSEQKKKLIDSKSNLSQKIKIS